MNDYIAFLTDWAADIRKYSGADGSVDAECLEAAANEIKRLKENEAELLEVLRLVEFKYRPENYPTMPGSPAEDYRGKTLKIIRAAIAKATASPSTQPE